MPDIQFDVGHLIAILAINLPLVLAFIVAQQRGILVFGRQHDAIVKGKDERIVELEGQLAEHRAEDTKREAALRLDFENRITFMDERRREEREGRISAERRVTTLTQVTSDLVNLMQDIRVELARVFGQGHATGEPRT